MKKENLADLFRRYVKDEVAREALLSALAQRFEGEDGIPADRRSFSIGFACELLQISPRLLRYFMRLANVEFAGAHNEIPYLDGHGLIKVARQRLLAKPSKKRPG